jgi:hypothetical protein
MRARSRSWFDPRDGGGGGARHWMHRMERNYHIEKAGNDEIQGTRSSFQAGVFAEQCEDARWRIVDGHYSIAHSPGQTPAWSNPACTAHSPCSIYQPSQTPRGSWMSPMPPRTRCSRWCRPRRPLPCGPRALPATAAVWARAGQTSRPAGRAGLEQACLVQPRRPSPPAGQPAGDELLPQPHVLLVGGRGTSTRAASAGTSMYPTPPPGARAACGWT